MGGWAEMFEAILIAADKLEEQGDPLAEDLRQSVDRIRGFIRQKEFPERGQRVCSTQEVSFQALNETRYRRDEYLGRVRAELSRRFWNHIEDIYQLTHDTSIHIRGIRSVTSESRHQTVLVGWDAEVSVEQLQPRGD